MLTAGGGVHAVRCEVIQLEGGSVFCRHRKEPGITVSRALLGRSRNAMEGVCEFCLD